MLECSKQCLLKITATHPASLTLTHLEEKKKKKKKMGKYTRKAKTTAAVSSPSCLGVSTRARTLALQHLGSSPDAPPPSKPDACYLELRSRRLEKRMQRQNPTDARRGCGCGGGGDATVEEFVRPVSTYESIEGEELGIEASFGENKFDFGTAERSTRESTPCSSIKAANIATTPGSTTKQTCSSPAGQITRAALAINAPSANELEAFFTHAEELLHYHYVDKYNFDFSKGLPLPGRYEWEAVGS